MKNLILILTFISNTFCFGQRIIDSTNVVDNSQTKPINTLNPLYITNDNIFLSTKAVGILFERKKVADIIIPGPGGGYLIKRFNEPVKNGIIILKLKDTTLSTEGLLKFVTKIHPNSNVAISNIRVNGLSTRGKIKYSINDQPIIDYDPIKKIYHIKIE